MASNFDPMMPLSLPPLPPQSPLWFGQPDAGVHAPFDALPGSPRMHVLDSPSSIGSLNEGDDDGDARMFDAQMVGAGARFVDVPSTLSTKSGANKQNLRFNKRDAQIRCTLPYATVAVMRWPKGMTREARHRWVRKYEGEKWFGRAYAIFRANGDGVVNLNDKHGAESEGAPYGTLTGARASDVVAESKQFKLVLLLPHVSDPDEAACLDHVDLELKPRSRKRKSAGQDRGAAPPAEKRYKYGTPEEQQLENERLLLENERLRHEKEQLMRYCERLRVELLEQKRQRA